jgi:uncharacterized circularly permuted ATP-grasp superfamily protein/uncharacterized alpha-E superfamily protein
MDVLKEVDSATSPWEYSPDDRYYDELASAPGKIRPHWRNVMSSLESIGQGDIARRWDEAGRLIRENGVTYNVYGDPHGTDRPWPLDPIPLVIATREWEHIEAAVAQRAKLLNAILGDLYGPQRLIKEHHLPPELLYENAGYLRSCQGLKVPGDIRLHFYAADIARAPDGHWWVIADRTQAPSGAGYALENRLVSTSTLPDVFRNAQVQRLAPFFQTIRDTMLQLAPGRSENPRIVLLTPGPYNETYFEHAYLARYLGYTLVEGGDLTVRDNRVYMKTLGGLLPVDMILRRQDDNFCDPLELREDSKLGVPGLVHALRAGNIAIANALGTGLAETPALSAFLPGLCRHLLYEKLKMPSVATWWCGQEEPLQFVAEHLDSLVIKSVSPAFGEHPVFGARLSAKQKHELMEKIRLHPHRYVAQEQVALSTAPVWTGEGLQPRHTVVRVYAVPCGDGYKIMPGGLTRVTNSLDTLVVSVQRGGGSKDTWVLSDGQPHEFSLLRHPSQPLEVSRATIDLPSRMADNLFWLGRYMERVEAAVRLARCLTPKLTQQAAEDSEGVQAVAEVLTHGGYVRDATENLESELVSMIFDSDKQYSIGWIVHEVRRVAWLLRERISTDAWRVLNRLDQDFSSRRPPEPLELLGASEVLDQAILTLAAFSGLVMESMTRGQGWHFLNIGRRLERAMQMVDLLRYGLGAKPTASNSRLSTLLEIADSSITYRSRYLTTMQADLVLDLLLLDEGNPRSLAFQLKRLDEYITRLPETKHAARRSTESKYILRMVSSIRLIEIGDLIQLREDGKWGGLEEFLDRLAVGLRGLSGALASSYFTHSAPAQQLKQV